MSTELNTNVESMMNGVLFVAHALVEGQAETPPAEEVKEDPTTKMQPRKRITSSSI